MSILRTLLNRYFRVVQESLYSRLQLSYNMDLSFREATLQFTNKERLYAYMHHYFHHGCPEVIRVHRNFFKQKNRGFGEDAFHAMWFTLLREFRPMECLEIGVYRGQVISLWALIAHKLDFSCDVHGISPFSRAGDEVSAYNRNIDYLEDTLSHHQHFGLTEPTLLRALSTDSEALSLIRSRDWSLIYIDGNHDYEVALSDYEECRNNLAEGGLLVMDDSSLYTDYRPPRFSFAGHPGPSQVVQERAMKELKFLGGVGHNNIFIKA